MTKSLAACLCLVLVGGAACSARRNAAPPTGVDADRFLFERGQEALTEEHWLDARQYFRQIDDNYPQSPYRPDAKLAVGDTYIGEHTTESLILAVAEFREFQTFYPTNPRADYAQFRLARAYAEQMLKPERDQTATKDTIRELQAFVDRYPNSSLMPEAMALLRDARDRLSEASYRVGLFYYRFKVYRGAIARFRDVLEADPAYTGRDAVYYYLAESLVLTQQQAEALPYYERLLHEFEQSEYIPRAQERVAELKGANPTGR
jgi:outer membrane protein assembly factor BamD